jgi:hypothetical protein
MAAMAASSLVPVAAQATATVVLREPREGGAVLKRGTSLSVAFYEGSPTEVFCTYLATGKLASNLRTTDAITVGLPLECGPGAWTGTLTAVRVNVAGTVSVSFKPKLAVTTEGGSCRYETAKLSGPLSLPGYFGPQIEVTALATRNSELSRPSCARHEPILAAVEVYEGNRDIYAEVGA